MLRGLVHVLAWSLATGAAVTLSWWGVHTVLAGTAYDPPRALPVTAAAGAASREPQALATTEPEPSASASVSAPVPKSPSPSASPTRQPSADPKPSGTGGAATPPSADSGQVRSYDTEGGRAVFDIGAYSATLVSATPGTDWSMQVWKTETWIRLEFAKGADRVSVFCTWHDGPPRVDVETF
ncbi:hypothetical protein ACIQAC_24690 [Streptomyces sp. NPDC088387]|uniref:hypothetical protein n=1 Tax=Streptomyces sp. NPDC088387 TaxID=3365859 RepID=UPI0038039143